jgi:hypothetical protein
MSNRYNAPVRRACWMLAACLLGSAAGTAHAGGIPFAGNRPQSFQFSTDFKDPYDSFGQYLQYNDDKRAFNSAGDKVPGSGGETIVGLSSRLHYFKVDALPDWGFLAAVTVPEVRVQAHQSAASGIGDPLVGGLAFTNPIPGMTAGVQAYVQVPIGSEQVSTNTWSVWPSVFVNHWAGNVNVDLLVGAIVRGTTNKSGVPDVDAGNTYHGNLRIGYSLSPPQDPFAIPFISVDTQRTTPGHLRAGGGAIAQSDSRETALGLGVLFQLKPGSTSLWRNQKTYDQLSFHYARGVSGKNTSVTNGLFVQYWHYW